MSNADFGSFTIFLFLLLAAARMLGHLFTRMRQPIVVGEILAGVLLGPSLLGRFAPLPCYLAAVFTIEQAFGFCARYEHQQLLSAGLRARLAGFGFSDSANLAAALNARGGPGIVLASVAFDAGIINAVFYSTLVLVAIFTSQGAGAWLAHVLRTERPLLSGDTIDPRSSVARDVLASAV